MEWAGGKLVERGVWRAEMGRMEAQQNGAAEQAGLWFMGGWMGKRV